MPFLRSKECTLVVREVVETHRERMSSFERKRKNVEEEKEKVLQYAILL